jgi:uncharacterized Fe-S cluster protein YjdI
MDPRDRKYSNGEISVYWKPKACIHSSICYINLLDVFNPRKRPWVNMEGAPTEKIIEIVNQCPTEALTWKWDDEARNSMVTEADTNHIKFKRPDLIKTEEEEEVMQIEGSEPIQIKVVKNGPLLMEGNFLLNKSDGTKKSMKGVSSFCRCGNSKSMPFCDGTHHKTGFSE